MLRFRKVIKQNYIDFALYFALKFQTNDFGLHLSEMNIVISTLDSDLLLSLGTLDQIMLLMIITFIHVPGTCDFNFGT